MRDIKAKILMLLALFLSISATGDALPTDPKEEISHLFSYLESTSCEFYRNGSWHSGKEAVAHLKKKYQYLLDRKLVSSAESFIERAATKSSISGKAYKVRCEGADPVDSGPWFNAELIKFRAKTPGR